MVAHWAHNPGVVGSIPALAPKNIINANGIKLAVEKTTEKGDESLILLLSRQYALVAFIFIIIKKCRENR